MKPLEKKRESFSKMYKNEEDPYAEDQTDEDIDNQLAAIEFFDEEDDQT